MLPFNLQKKDPLKLLCLGAHCDDIEIGAGGTLLKLLQEYLKQILNQKTQLQVIQIKYARLRILKNLTDTICSRNRIAPANSMESTHM